MRFAAAISIWFLVTIANTWASPSSNIAGQQNLIFDRLHAEDGLSQGIATAITQDKDGFIWIGTQEGLNRYDGFRFEKYFRVEEDPASLSHDYIRALYVDSNGTLWVGTEAGLDRYVAESKTFERVKLGNSANPVYEITSFADQLLIGSSEGLFLGTAESGFKLFAHDSDDQGSIGQGRVRSIRVLTTGEILVGTEGSGVFSFSMEEGVFEKLDLNLRDFDIRGIVESSSGDIWVASFNGGVARLSSDRQASHLYYPGNSDGLMSSRVRSILEDHRADIWIATDKGLHKWSGENKFRVYQHDLTNPRSISDNTILELYQDIGGVIWIGTFNGLNRWNAKVNLFPYFRRPQGSSEATTSNNVTSFTQDSKGDLWIGTFDGLIRWNRTDAVLENVDVEMKDARVMSLGQVDNVLWAGTMAYGIAEIAGDSVVRYHTQDQLDDGSLSSNAVTKIYKDDLGRTWVATYGGGVNLHLGDGRFRRFPGQSGERFPDLRCLDIVQIADGSYWIATQGGGVVILDPETGETELLQHDSQNPNSIPSNEVLTLLESDDGVWIGSVNRGLSFVDHETKRITRYSKADGLASDAVYGLLADSGSRIWASGAKGLSVLDPETKSITLFDTSHGLQGTDFNSGAYALLPDGSMAFGGSNGFNVFYPEDIRLNQYVPPVHITSFKKFNLEYGFTQPLQDVRSIELDHTDTVTGFEFAALDFTAPEKNRYRYILKGFDRDWIELEGGRDVTYTNLDAGEYVFKVQGSNNDGVWNEKGTSLRLVVTPAPWLTWWAYCIYFVVFVFIAYRLFKYNTERLQREAERRYSERLQLYIESLEEASDCILIADSSGVLMYANNTITHGLNRSPSEVIGESMWSVLFEDDEDIKFALSQLEGEGRYHGEVLLSGPDGSSITHDVTIALVQQSSLSEEAYVGISRDVTDRKITEAELEDYRRNLEELVEERTEALQKEIAENKAIQVHLADSLQEKELLIKEVHHRVKNNMQVISSLLSIQAQGAGDEIYSNLLNESQQRIKSMALIHETLYQSKDLLKIDFQEYIESLTTSLSRSYVVPGVSVLVDVNVENVELDLETAVPCGLLINELVSNSLKHAFKGKEGTGLINIKFGVSQCNFSLRIADNGVGLPDNFDPSNNTSMGMEIVSILTTQLEGELKAHNDEGAVFEISFPRAANV